MATALRDALELEMDAIGRAAREASGVLASVDRSAKDRALRSAAGALRESRSDLLAANEDDLEDARTRGLAAAAIDRLEVDGKRIEAMALGLEAVAELDDPVGRELARWSRPNGLDIARVRVPLGVIGIIYESRPNVTADAGALCLKAGNAAILRGGSESVRSSAVILRCLHTGLEDAGLPATAIQSLPTSDRHAVGILLRMSDWVDVIVPRGGRSLIERVRRESTIPVLAHLDGNCHVYIHEAADPRMAIDVTLNAKLRRTGVCGAAESILIDRHVARTMLPPLVEALSAAGCEVRADEIARSLDGRIVPASANDWGCEYLDRIVSLKTVEGLEEAIGHIETFGSHHTDSIITDDASAAETFLARVDSAIVMHNASTQFADGGEFGMGAEIGIATGRLHARGPVGVEQLTSFKYVVRGRGHTRPV